MSFHAEKGRNYMIDIHSHILPGVDDGSPDLEMSLRMLKMAADNGTKSIIATPHVIESRNVLTWDNIKKISEDLQAEAEKVCIDIKIFPGAEVELNYEMLEYIRSGKNMYGLAESRYILIEMPMLQYPVNLEDMIYELQLMGRFPILAHPERQRELMKKPEVLLNMLRKGVLTQSNGNSITGSFGTEIKHNVDLLLRNKMVTFVASDAHNCKNRKTSLSHAKEVLTDMLGETEMSYLTGLNQEYIITDEEFPEKRFLSNLPDSVKEKEVKKKSLFGFFRF